MIGLEPAHKKKFQLDRMILFSDAVFAIAITLLVLEIKIPHVGNEPDSKLMEMLLLMIPKFIGFFISFFYGGAILDCAPQAFWICGRLQRNTPLA